MDKDLNITSMTDYILRKTKEQVEVVDCYQKEKGMRSEEDWVSYIDSEGKEHIREKLNIQLDFKFAGNINPLFKNLFNTTSYKLPKMPSIDNTRAFEVTKSLLAHYENLTVEQAIEIGKEVAIAFHEDLEDDDNKDNKE